MPFKTVYKDVSNALGKCMYFKKFLGMFLVDCFYFSLPWFAPAYFFPADDLRPENVVRAAAKSQAIAK